MVIGATSNAEGRGIFGIEPDRLTVVGDGAVFVVLGAEGDTSTEEGHGEFRIDPDHLIEVGDGAVVVALGAITVTSIGVVSRQIASFPFPRIDALCTVNDRSLGVLRTITLVGGG